LLLRLWFGRWLLCRLVGVVTQRRTSPGVDGGDVLLEVLFELGLVALDLTAGFRCASALEALGESLAGCRGITGQAGLVGATGEPARMTLASTTGLTVKEHEKLVPSVKSIWSSVPSPVSL
jgi:hypothetical protein